MPPMGRDAASGGSFRHRRRGRVARTGGEEELEERACEARTATPGQAGPPAEFKHIDKRRGRNLRGFPK